MSEHPHPYPTLFKYLQAELQARHQDVVKAKAGTPAEDLARRRVEALVDVDTYLVETLEVAEVVMLELLELLATRLRELQVDYHGQRKLLHEALQAHIKAYHRQ